MRSAAVRVRWLAGAALVTALLSSPGGALARSQHQSSCVAGCNPPGWSDPFRLAGPFALDPSPARIAVSGTGQSAVGFGLGNQDDASFGEGFATLRSAAGGLSGARRVPDAKQVLDLAYDGPVPYLLTGNSSGEPCCSSADVTSFNGGQPTGTRQLVGGLSSATVGTLLTLPGRRLLAAIATAGGIWVAQSSGGSRFGPTRRLTASGVVPWALATTSLPGGRTVVAWTATAEQTFATAPQSIAIARGTAQHAPSGAGVAVTVPAGHQIDELAMARAADFKPTAAWIESWYDAQGTYHSVVSTADLGLTVDVTSFAEPSAFPSGLSLAADARGDQVLTWSSCDPLGSCIADAAVRAGGQRFGRPVALGSIDASQAPAATVAPNGQMLVGWISGGDLVIADRRSPKTGFSSPRTVSASGAATDPALAFEADGDAIAVWSQGTATESVMAAIHRGP